MLIGRAEKAIFGEHSIPLVRYYHNMKMTNMEAILRYEG